MITGVLGIIFGLVAGVCLLVGLIPLLGWINWITSIPLALVGLVFSRVSAHRSVGKSLGIAGTVLSLGVIVVALFRLFLGGGFL